MTPVAFRTQGGNALLIACTQVDLDGGGSIDLDEWVNFFRRQKESGGEAVVEFVTGYLESRLHSQPEHSADLAQGAEPASPSSKTAHLPLAQRLEELFKVEWCWTDVW